MAQGKNRRASAGRNWPKERQLQPGKSAGEFGMPSCRIEPLGKAAQSVSGSTGAVDALFDLHSRLKFAPFIMMP